jgi:phosphotransferase system  glucose/maltose/N-acetylglucosamine-specific IIC component
MMWLYDIPTWLLGVGIVGATTIVCLSGFVSIHKVVRSDRTDEISNVALSFISIICAFHSLLIAFSAVLVWQDFQDSENAVAVEASTIENVYRDLSIYGGTQAETAQRILLDYARSVVQD